MTKKIGLIYNAGKKENTEIVKKLESLLSSKGFNFSTIKTGIKENELNGFNENLDYAIVLGGDGTLLGSSRILAPKNIPMFGVNTGHLGFLTEWKSGNITDIVEKVLSDQYRVEERAMLSAEITSTDPTHNIKNLYALNDVVINRGSSRKMINMTLNVDEKPVADYTADGLIISTPTGSTAYALSAGGAVMDPGIKGIEIVPICAHTLTNRPYIVADERTLTITFNKSHEGTILQLDSQETFPINSGAKVKITRSKFNAKLMRLLGEESGFYWTIRQKFHWGSTIQ